MRSAAEKKRRAVIRHEFRETNRSRAERRDKGQMKEDAVLINIGRGGHVDQDALVAHLRAHPRFVAALDVTDPEPLPPTHPLLELSNCIVTPHLGTATVKTRTRVAQMSVDNLFQHLATAE